MHPQHPADACASNQSAQRPPRPTLHGPGRPRVLDDGKRREICALIAGGCGLREAAKYVHCSVNTIRREAERNVDFAEQLRHSESYARLSPLRAMQAAMGTHWRAAAWFLERAFPEQFARPDAGAFGARKARELMKEVIDIVRAEVFDPFKSDRVEKRIRGAFEYYIRMACDQRKNSHSLRRAMQFFEDKNRVSGPLAEFGIPTPDFSDFTNPTRTSTSSPFSPPKKKRHPDSKPSKRDDPREPQSARRESPSDTPRRAPGYETNGATPPDSPTPMKRSTDPLPPTGSLADEFLKHVTKLERARAAKAKTLTPSSPPPSHADADPVHRMI